MARACYFAILRQALIQAAVVPPSRGVPSRSTSTCKSAHIASADSEGSYEIMQIATDCAIWNRCADRLFSS